MLLAGQLRIQDLIVRIGFPFCPMWAAGRRSSGGLLDGEGGGGGGLLVALLPVVFPYCNMVTDGFAW